MTDILASLEQATQETVETVHRSYITAALWSSTDDDEEPLDANYTADDLSDSASESMLTDCLSFLQTCWGDTREGFSIDLSGIEPEQIGHDFWLTRNHHGAGFWDRGLGAVGEALTSLAESYGGSDLYVGDDGLIYVSP